MNTQVNLIARCMFAIVTASCACCSYSVAQDQSSAQSQKQTAPAAPSTSTELVDGLMDLLNEPAANTSASPKAKPPLTPEDVGLEGEDLGEAPENPLQSVRQSMLIAAAYLTREGANQDTMKLQSDIVRRLDELIAEMEKSQGQQSKSKQDSEQSSAKSKSQQQQTQQSQPMKSRSGERQDTDGGQEQKERTGEPENPPTQRGGQGAVAVELSDPKALQQDVWGQLPSRVRQQMQSRMVEQFLPAYREQIEAYFQALLK